MLRLALPLSIALLAIVGAGAAEASTVIPVSGEIRALAFSGDALVVARVLPAGGLVLERLVAGSPAQTILTTSLDGDDDEITLAASTEALAFGAKPEPEGDFAASRVMVGPASGPLREVASCPAALLVSPVSVVGSRIAWRDGACGEPASQPTGVSQAAIVVAGADPAAPVRRVAIAPERLPIALVLAAGDTGLVGTLQPSFFGFDTEARAFSPAGLGATLTADRARLVTPVGLLADGARVFVQSDMEDEDDECDTSKLLFTLAAGATDRRPIALGGCLIARSGIGPRAGTSPVATADRIVAFVGASPSNSGQRGESTGIVSVRGDGSDRRMLVKGGYRRPQGVAADGARVAWWQPRCAGGQEIVVQPAPEPRATLAACRAEILTRSARLRGGRIVVRVRCPAGCTGSVLGGVRYPPRTFAFGAGTHRLGVPLALGRRRRAVVRIELAIDHGPMRSASISVRR